MDCSIPWIGLRESFVVLSLQFGLKVHLSFDLGSLCSGCFLLSKGLFFFLCFFNWINIIFLRQIMSLILDQRVSMMVTLSKRFGRVESTLCEHFGVWSLILLTWDMISRFGNLVCRNSFALSPIGSYFSNLIGGSVLFSGMLN